MFSRFFIDRPVFAWVLSLLIMLAGLASIQNLPVEQYPDLLPPSISVTATYTGATPQVLAETVAAPLEQNINGVDDMIYMTSNSSSTGTLSLTIYFATGTDPDQALINVNNRIQQALTSLPEIVQRYGVTAEKRSSSILMLLAVISPDDRYDTIYLSNYVSINIIDPLSRISGVGQASNFTSQNYAMRVWLSPDKLTQLELTPNDIINAITEQNDQYAAGRMGQRPMDNEIEMVYNLIVPGRLNTPEEFGNIIIRADSAGTILRLSDVARVELGAEAYDFVGKLDGAPTIPIGIFLSPGANALETSTRVLNTMEQLKKQFPEGVDYKVVLDTTTFVRISIEEVVHTLIEAMILVFAVVFIFLQNWRATLIPCLAVPVSIIGTFAGMYIMGFSINTLTMFGMVLAIGIVVDDAIVVIENVERIMGSEKLPARDATIKAMSEVTGPVVAVVLVLCSVFIPVAFLGGMTGLMYKQFAVTIAVSVAISGFVALTLTPALCAILLKPSHSEAKGIFAWFNNGFTKLTNGFVSGVTFLLRRVLVGLLLFGGLIALLISLFGIVPSSLVPEEDQGYLMSIAYLPQGASISRSERVMDELDHFTINHDDVAIVCTFSGYDMLTGSSKSYAGSSFIALKPWDERKEKTQSSFAMARDIINEGKDIPEAILMAFNPPPITGMSNTGGFEGYIMNQGQGDYDELAAMVQTFIQAANARPELTGVSTTFEANSPQLKITIDREKVKSLGLGINDVFKAMESTYGAYYVNDFNKYFRTFRVMIQAEKDFRALPEDILEVYVRSNSGEMVPLSALLTMEHIIGPDIVQRFNLFPAAQLVGGPAPGYTSGQALAAMEEVAAEILPSTYGLSWTGSAFQEKLVGDASTRAFVMGIILVILILAAQYERWRLPFAVITAVPFGILGALLAVWGRGLTNDIYFQIAMLTLIGLSAKNAILIIEFAVILWENGMSIFESAREAVRLRFRPIVMTSLAFMMGCLPLAISSGAGAASRHSIGTGIIGGMLVATIVAPLFIPFFFSLIMRGARSNKKNTEAPDTPIPNPNEV